MHALMHAWHVPTLGLTQHKLINSGLPNIFWKLKRNNLRHNGTTCVQDLLHNPKKVYKMLYGMLGIAYTWFMPCYELHIWLDWLAGQHNLKVLCRPCPPTAFAPARSQVVSTHCYLYSMTPTSLIVSTLFFTIHASIWNGKRYLT